MVLWYRDLTKNIKMIGSLDDLTQMITYGPYNMDQDMVTLYVRYCITVLFSPV